MIVRAIDEDGDWTFGKGIEDYKSNLDALVQNIRTRLYSFLGNCFFAVNDGIDWFNLIGSKNQVGLNLAVSGTILSTAGVTSILQLSLTLNADRKITVQYNAQTVYGATGQQVFQYDVVN